jgi:hypothetical protein
VSATSRQPLSMVSDVVLIHSTGQAAAGWERVVHALAAHDRTIRPAWQRRMARERLGVEPIEIASGHCPNVSQPDRLAEILVDLDRTVSGGPRSSGR